MSSAAASTEAVPSIAVSTVSGVLTAVAEETEPARRTTRLLESIALGTVLVTVVAAEADVSSAAVAGTANIIEQAAAKAVTVAILCDFLREVGWLMVFIKIITFILM